MRGEENVINYDDAEWTSSSLPSGATCSQKYSSIFAIGCNVRAETNKFCDDVTLLKRKLSFNLFFYFAILTIRRFFKN